MASPWILLQYAECFASGFLTSYLLCSRSSKNRVENEVDILSDDIEKLTEIVVITEETVTKMTDLKNDCSYGGIADAKQEEQAKQNREEAKIEQEQYAEQGKEDKNTEQWMRRETFQKII